MPRQYKQKPGSRLYLTNYLSNSIHQAIQAIKSRSMYYQSAKKFNVPKSTLMRRCKDQQSKKPGGTEITYKFISLVHSWQAYSEPCQTSNIEPFAKIVIS